jgi:hypothetical protein
MNDLDDLVELLKNQRVVGESVSRIEAIDKVLGENRETKSS